jgi:hypothetical protein
VTSYFRNRVDGVFAKHEGDLVYIWDSETKPEPGWTIMPAEILTNNRFEPFYVGTEVEFLDKVRAGEPS